MCYRLSHATDHPAEAEAGPVGAGVAPLAAAEAVVAAVGGPVLAVGVISEAEAEAEALQVFGRHHSRCNPPENLGSTFSCCEHAFTNYALLFACLMQVFLRCPMGLAIDVWRLCA